MEKLPDMVPWSQTIHFMCRKRSPCTRALYLSRVQSCHKKMYGSILLKKCSNSIYKMHNALALQHPSQKAPMTSSQAVVFLQDTIFLNMFSISFNVQNCLEMPCLISNISCTEQIYLPQRTVQFSFRGGSTASVKTIFFKRMMQHLAFEETSTLLQSEILFQAIVAFERSSVC